MLFSKGGKSRIWSRMRRRTRGWIGGTRRGGSSVTRNREIRIKGIRRGKYFRVLIPDSIAFISIDKILDLNKN